MEILNYFKNIFSNSQTDESKIITSEDAVEKSATQDLSLENWLKGYSTDSITQPYKQHYIIHRGIELIANNIAQVPAEIIVNGEVATNHPAIRLFDKPNENTSRFEMWEQIGTYMPLYGEAFLYFNDSVTGMPVEMFVLNPTLVRHTLNSNGEVTGWMYNDKVPLELENTLHFKNFNPYNPIRGLSPIESIKLEYQTDYESSIYSKAFFKNSARPDGIIESEKGMSEAEATRLIEQWNASGKGSSNSSKVRMLMGAKYNQLGMSQKDMDFIEGRKDLRDRILVGLGVHKVVAGFTEEVNRATAETAKKLFWQETIKPMLVRIQEKINAEIFMTKMPEARFRFDFSVIQELQPNFKETIEGAKGLIELGYTRNEVNVRLSLDMPTDDPDGDVRRISTTLQSVEDSSIDNSKSLEVELLEKADEKLTKYLEYKEQEEQKLLQEEKKSKEDRFYDEYLLLLDTHEKVFTGKIRKYLFEQRKEVLRAINVKEKAIDEDNLGGKIEDLKDAQNLKLEKALKSLYEAAGLASSEFAYRTLNVDKVGIANPIIVDEMINKIRGINDTIFKELKAQIFIGLNDGESLPQIEKRLKSVYNFANNRAKVIARTETNKIVSATTHNIYKEEGVGFKKWLALPDSRPEHSTNAAQGPIPIDQNFQNSQPYPGVGTAAQVINCRCALQPILELEV